MEYPRRDLTEVHERTRREIDTLRADVVGAIVNYVTTAHGPTLFIAGISDAVRGTFCDFMGTVHTELPRELRVRTQKGADLVIDTAEGNLYNAVELPSGRRRYPTSATGWLLDHEDIIAAIGNTLSAKRVSM